MSPNAAMASSFFPQVLPALTPQSPHPTMSVLESAESAAFSSKRQTPLRRGSNSSIDSFSSLNDHTFTTALPKSAMLSRLSSSKPIISFLIFCIFLTCSFLFLVSSDGEFHAPANQLKLSAATMDYLRSTPVPPRSAPHSRRDSTNGDLPASIFVPPRQALSAERDANSTDSDSDSSADSTVADADSSAVRSADEEKRNLDSDFRLSRCFNSGIELNENVKEAPEADISAISRTANRERPQSPLVLKFLCFLNFISSPLVLKFLCFF